jgi:sucrose-6-phosphate hydrolase SacC (GH32 family)
LKPWSDDYGLLYIALKPDSTLQQSALYSGSILRISPTKFGLKNYTVPTHNPFLKDPKVEDEVIMIGAQNIQQFTWSKKEKNKLILTHT